MIHDTDLLKSDNPGIIEADFYSRNINLLFNEPGTYQITCGNFFAFKPDFHATHANIHIRGT